MATSLMQTLRTLILPIVLIIVLGNNGTAVAASPDRLEVVRLSALPGDTNSPSSSIRFRVQVNYTLDSSPNGYLGLFLFEDNAQRSSQNESNAMPIGTGAGRATMEIEYAPSGPRVKALTLIVGLFDQQQQLLGWVSTNPMSLADWAGRIEFEEAMASRLAGKQEKAIEHLTLAIKASPDTGNLYYWRADTLIRIGQYDEAIADYTKALELMPQHRASLLGRGIARIWNEQWASAIEDLTAVLDADSEPDAIAASAHRARGVLYAAMGRPAEAISDYETYLSMVPDASDRTNVVKWIDQLKPLVKAGS